MANIYCLLCLDDDKVNRNSVGGGNDVAESGNDVTGSFGGAKSAEEYNYDDVTAEKKAPASFVRNGRKYRFVRIGKKSADGDRLKTADEYSGELGKRIPPGALFTEKRRVKFVRIGRRHNSAGVGKSHMESETETAQRADRAAPRTSRKVKFVRIGRKPTAFVRIGKPYSSDERNSAAVSDDIERNEPPRRLDQRESRLKFVRIGRNYGEQKRGSQRVNTETLADLLQNIMV